MPNIPDDLIRKIVMMNRPKYPFTNELKSSCKVIKAKLDDGDTKFINKKPYGRYNGGYEYKDNWARRQLFCNSPLSNSNEYSGSYPYYNKHKIVYENEYY